MHLHDAVGGWLKSGRESAEKMTGRGFKLVVGLIGFALFAWFAMSRTGIDLGPLFAGGARTADVAAPASTKKAQAGAACAVDASGIVLSSSLRETSGIAHAADGSLWTHNDGDEARLYRIGDDGAIAQTVDLDGTRAADIEDIDAAPCPGGTGDCLWLADTGDNDGERPEVALLVLPVPSAGATRATPTRLAFTWPEGPRDSEALAMLPDGRAVLVTKGRDTPIAIYALDTGGPVGAPAAPRVARPIAQLAPMPDDRRLRVGAAGASEDGAWIAIRTEVELAVFRTGPLLQGETTPVFTQDLTPLRESQGEGVELASDGRVWLTSEGERGSPTLARLRCTLPE